MTRNFQLLLLTDFYPFEVREPFVKNEIPFLAKSFAAVHVLCSHKEHQKPLYSLPPNVSAAYIDNSLTAFGKILSLRWLFSAIFWREVFYIRKTYRLRFAPRIVKTMLLTLQIAAQYKRQLQNYLAKKPLGSDSLVIYSYWTDARAIAAAWLKQSMPLIAITRAHGWDVYFERQTPPYLPFRKFMHDNLDAVYFVSENGLHYSLDKIKSSTRQKFRVSMLGTFFHKRNPDNGSVTRIIVTNAGLIPLKRVFLVPGILARIKDIPIHWIHFGYGPMKREIERYAVHRLKDLKNISFEFIGHIENEELMEFYGDSHIDLFLHTSEIEGLPVVIMEAFSFGIPVMAANVGGIGKMVNDDNGFLLERDFKPEHAAALIESYFRSPEAVKQKKRDAAFQTWQHYFNAEKNYTGFINDIFSFTKS